MIEPYPPHWFAFYFVLGLLLGQWVIRDWKWAALCGLVNALAVVYVLPQLELPLFSPTIRFVLAGVGLLALWGISRLPQSAAQVGAAILVMPFVSWPLVMVGMIAAWFLFKTS